MLTVLVRVSVKADRVDDFIRATRENASRSLLEPGVARFDLLRQADDPARFLLIEVYRDSEAPARHKETAHYAKWRDAVQEMMAEPRASTKYDSIYPD